MYEIENVNAELLRKLARDTKKPLAIITLYPFEQLQDSQGFTVPAADKGTHQKVRMMAYRFAKKTGRGIRCSRMPDGSLKVWRDDTFESRAETPEQDDSASFCAYVASVGKGSSFSIPATLATRHSAYKEQLDAYAMLNDCAFDIEVTPDGAMNVTKK